MWWVAKNNSLPSQIDDFNLKQAGTETDIRYLVPGRIKLFKMFQTIQSIQTCKMATIHPEDLKILQSTSQISQGRYVAAI